MTDSLTRLNKYLAFQLGISRREADELIEQGRVMLGSTVAQLGSQVDDMMTISVDGKPIDGIRNYQYILFNKPAGYVCSRRKQGDNETIYALLPENLHHLKPVGRLDKDSSGLLLLTNDGDFAHTMTHPSFHKVKVYEVSLDHALEPLHQQMISDYGVMLEDGKSQFIIEKIKDDTSVSLADLTPLEPRRPAQEAKETASVVPHYKITMHEGRNRQIRRTFAALGYRVTRLHRTNFGHYSLGDIKPGEFEAINIH